MAGQRRTGQSVLETDSPPISSDPPAAAEFKLPVLLNCRGGLQAVTFVCVFISYKQG